MPAAGEIFKQIALCRVKLQHLHEKKLAFEFSRGGPRPPRPTPEHAYKKYILGQDLGIFQSSNVPM